MIQNQTSAENIKVEVEELKLKKKASELQLEKSRKDGERKDKML